MTAPKPKSAGNPQKQAVVSEIKDKLEKAKAFFLTDYKGLTHQQLEGLRKALKKVEAEYVIAKNTLLKLALKLSGNQAMEELEKELNNPTATLFAYKDEIAAVKQLAAFIKTTQLPKVKLGFFGGKVATEADFMKLSTLPSREILLSTLVCRLNGPIQGLHYSLQWNLQKFVTVLGNIKNKKPAN